MAGTQDAANVGRILKFRMVLTNEDRGSQHQGGSSDGDLLVLSSVTYVCGRILVHVPVSQIFSFNFKSTRTVLAEESSTTCAPQSPPLFLPAPV
jgi:hypothetical protein